MCDYCAWIAEVLAKIDVREKKKSLRADPVVIVHGGAGKIPRYARKFMLEEVKKAAVAAYCDLIKGCSSLDAVERAIRHLERKKYFNCAFGGSLDANGEVVMDAAIMTEDFRAGCVGAVRNISHPITLAKKILQNTEHVLIVEIGAQKLALESGMPSLSSDQLIVTSESQTSLHEEEDDEAQKARRMEESLQYENERSKKDCVSGCVIERNEKMKLYEDIQSLLEEISFTKLKESFELDFDFIQIGAVGAVAYDRKKRLAAGTSTAGKSGKLYGSVSATGTTIGCGIYVDEAGAVSVSGCDKAIYKYTPAHRILRQLQSQRKSASPEQVLSAVFKSIKMETGTTDIGAIALTADRVPSVSFRCPHFPWAYCDKGYVHYGCARHEKFLEKVDVVERPLDCVCDEDAFN